jgi:hypothetical protein
VTLVGLVIVGPVGMPRNMCRGAVFEYPFCQALVALGTLNALFDEYLFKRDGDSVADP